MSTEESKSPGFIIEGIIYAINVIWGETIFSLSVKPLTAWSAVISSPWIFIIHSPNVNSDFLFRTFRYSRVSSSFIKSSFSTCSIYNQYIYFRSSYSLSTLFLFAFSSRASISFRLRSFSSCAFYIIACSLSILFYLLLTAI